MVPQLLLYIIRRINPYGKVGLMKASVLAMALLLGATAAHAAAKISAKDSEGLKYEISLDSKGTPRTNGNARTYPTIKDFREDGDVVFSCIKGTDAEIRKLLTALVDAANGDGDSWAELKGIYKNPKSWAVLASITDEGGERTERFSFPNCR